MSEHIRAEVLNEARAWIGTPYCHQASTKGAGCDCLGLIRGLWRHLYGAEPETVPVYRPDWDVRTGADSLILAASRHLDRVEKAAMQPGDVVVFRYQDGCVSRHCAILSTPDRIIHAWQGRRVCETTLGPWWRRRIAGVFSFPSS